MIFATLAFSSTLTLKSSATVTGQYVTLYDLAATYEGVSIQKLKAFIVAFAPQPGSSYILSADSVKIRAQNDIKWLKVFEKSKSIKVSSKAFAVNLSEIHDAIKSKMGREIFLTTLPLIELSTNKYTVEVQNISDINGEHFALLKFKGNGTNSYVNVGFETSKIGNCNSIDGIKSVVLGFMKKGISLSLVNEIPKVDFVQIEVGKPFKESLNMLKVPVNFILKGGKSFSTILKYRISLYADVVVARKYIPYGKKISNEDLATKKMNVYATSTSYATSIKYCVGKISMWSFRKGQIISLNGLKTPPDVLTGEILIAYVSYPTMTVTTFVRAMQDGNVGQVIAVRNVSNGYMLYGTIERGPKICIYSGGE